jgi:hypothetical protein
MGEAPPETDFYRRLKPHIEGTQNGEVLRQAYRLWVVDNRIRKELSHEFPPEKLPDTYHEDDETISPRIRNRWGDRREEYLRRSYFHGPPESYLEASRSFEDLIAALDHNLNQMRLAIEIRSRNLFPGDTPEGVKFQARRIKSPNMEQLAEIRAHLFKIRGFLK